MSEGMKHACSLVVVARNCLDCDMLLTLYALDCHVVKYTHGLTLSLFLACDDRLSLLWVVVDHYHRCCLLSLFVFVIAD